MERYGVALHDERGGLDCVSSQRLRDALCPVHSDGRGVFPPTMLVMLMCHGGAQGDVILPIGSVAHELHAAGIPWVLASQFPLSMEGSVTISDRLFPSLFLGDDPRLVLHSVRQSLRARGGHHDWASLVAYASIPSDFARQVQLSRRRAADLACSVLFNVIDNENQSLMQAQSAGAAPVGLSIEQRAAYEQLVDGYFQRIRDTQPREDTPETAADRAEVFGMLGGIERNRAFLLDTPALGSSPVRDLRKLRQRLDRARNFYAAARHGLEAELLWPCPSGLSPQPLPAGALIEQLIPVAHAGLLAAGVEAAEAGAQLAVITARVRSGRTGAVWQQRTLAMLERELPRPQALAAMLERYLTCAATAAPVHSWPCA